MMKNKKKKTLTDSSVRLYIDNMYTDELLEIEVQPNVLIGDILKMVSELLGGSDLEKTPLKQVLGYEGKHLDEQLWLDFYDIKNKSILDFIEYEDEDWSTDIEDKIEKFYLEAGGFKFPVDVELMPKSDATKVNNWSPV